MKKLLLAASLMASAVFSSFAGVVVNENPWHGGNAFTFTFTESGDYGLQFFWESITTPSEIHAFGYYFVDNPTNLIAGSFTSDTHSYYNEINNGIVLGGNVATVDANIGNLGSFKAGDTIGLWILTSRDFYGDNIFMTSSDTGLAAHTYTLCCVEAGDYTFENGYPIGNPQDSYAFYQAHFYYDRTFIRFVQNPHGEPLPGVLAALAIGGAIVAGKRMKSKIRK